MIDYAEEKKFSEAQLTKKTSNCTNGRRSNRYFVGFCISNDTVGWSLISAYTEKNWMIRQTMKLM